MQIGGWVDIQNVIAFSLQFKGLSSGNPGHGNEHQTDHEHQNRERARRKTIYTEGHKGH